VSLFHLTVCGIVCVYLLELSTSAVVVDPLFSTIRHPCSLVCVGIPCVCRCRCVRGGCVWLILKDHLGVGCVCMYGGIRRCDVVYGSCDSVGSSYVF
jgi:hypothetical protein